MITGELKPQISLLISTTLRMGRDSPSIGFGSRVALSLARDSRSKTQGALDVKPIALVATTQRWFSTARLVMGLAKAGFRIEAVCPANHPLEKTTVVPRPHVYIEASPLRSLSAAIAATKPTIIIPADDPATRELHQLHERVRRRADADEATCALIERSLGAPESFPTVERRAALSQLAAAAGVRVPETKVITERYGSPRMVRPLRPSPGA